MYSFRLWALGLTLLCSFSTFASVKVSVWNDYLASVNPDSTLLFRSGRINMIESIEGYHALALVCLKRVESECQRFTFVHMKSFYGQRVNEARRYAGEYSPASVPQFIKNMSDNHYLELLFKRYSLYRFQLSFFNAMDVNNGWDKLWVTVLTMPLTLTADFATSLFQPVAHAIEQARLRDTYRDGGRILEQFVKKGTTSRRGELVKNDRVYFWSLQEFFTDIKPM